MGWKQSLQPQSGLRWLKPQLMAWLQSSLEEILSQNHLAKLLLDSWLSGSAWYNKCLLFKLLSLWAIYYVIVGNWNRSIPHKVREIKFQLKVTVELQVSAQGAPGCCALGWGGFLLLWLRRGGTRGSSIRAPQTFLIRNVLNIEIWPFESDLGSYPSFSLNMSGTW